MSSEEKQTPSFVSREQHPIALDSRGFHGETWRNVQQRPAAMNAPGFPSSLASGGRLLMAHRTPLSLLPLAIRFTSFAPHSSLLTPYSLLLTPHSPHGALP